MIHKYGLYCVWVIATVASLVTFYLTEVQYWAPCHLCWYQQVCMLPLTFIAGLAAWNGFLGIAKYLLPQTLLGLGLSIYQVTLQITSRSPVKIPPIEICKPGCDETVFFNFFLNLPILSAIAFFIINLLLLIMVREMNKGEGSEKRHD